MAKRQQLEYDNQELTSNLRRSNGMGVDAFFPESEPSIPEQETADTIGSPQPSTDAHVHARMPTPTNAPADARIDTSISADTDEREHVRTEADVQVLPGAAADNCTAVMSPEQIDVIRRAIRARRHMTSYTFRFRGEELEELDRVVDELNLSAELKVSKNDVMRTAINWLLADYQKNKAASVLARVLTDT